MGTPTAVKGVPPVSCRLAHGVVSVKACCRPTVPRLAGEACDHEGAAGAQADGRCGDVGGEAGAGERRRATGPAEALRREAHVGDVGEGLEARRAGASFWTGHLARAGAPEIVQVEPVSESVAVPLDPAA